LATQAAISKVGQIKEAAGTVMPIECRNPGGVPCRRANALHPA